MVTNTKKPLLALDTVPSDLDIFKRLKRLEKFDKQNKDKPKLSQENSFFNFNISQNDLSANRLNESPTVKGTSIILEKPYFRLTQAPDPNEVRPLDILKKSLTLLQTKWRNKSNDYKYIDDQFRSLRQDLTVQHIENDFSVQVYETHARIALENADLDQFN